MARPSQRLTIESPPVDVEGHKPSMATAGGHQQSRCQSCRSIGEAVVHQRIRSEEYKRLKFTMERKSKKLERKKDAIGVDGDAVGGAGGANAASKTTKRKIEREEERLKSTNRDLSMFRMKSMLAIGFVFAALLSTFSSIFEGRVVAKLPFEPITWVQGLSHRNLVGDDFTDCSFIFLYILCTMSLRQNLQKLLGFAPSRSFNRQTQNMGGFFGQTAQSNQLFR